MKDTSAQVLVPQVVAIEEKNIIEIEEEIGGEEHHEVAAVDEYNDAALDPNAYSSEEE